MYELLTSSLTMVPAQLTETSRQQTHNLVFYFGFPD